MREENLQMGGRVKGWLARSLDCRVAFAPRKDKGANRHRDLCRNERALVVQSAATAVAGHAGTGWHFCRAGRFVGAGCGENGELLLQFGRTTVRAMGLAFPVGGANENFGVLVADRAGELVNRHRCIGVCRSQIGSIIGQQIEKPSNHIIAGNEDAGTK